MRKSLMLTVAAASLLTASSALGAGTWVPANVPMGGSNFSIFGINNSDVVVGDYSDSSGTIEGVFGPFDGSDWTNLSYPLQPLGIGPQGIITGRDSGTLYPWERSAKGKLKTITLDGNPVTGTAQQINKSGVFVGDHATASGTETGPAIGRRYKWTGVIKVKICNGGCAGRAIDDAGDVGGWYYDSSGIQHGFLKMGRKEIEVDYPNANYTVVEGINNRGIASGQWEDVNGVIHGFTYNIAKNKYTNLDAPGASFTQVWGLNDDGVVVASAAEPSGTESFAYCPTSKGCPSAGGVVRHPAQRSSREAVPEPN